jgi:polyhydroxyalkanoate synthesis regulator phasin
MTRKYEKTGKYCKANQRKQMYVYIDKWVELHGRVQMLEKRVAELEAELKENLIKNELYPNK